MPPRKSSYLGTWNGRTLSTMHLKIIFLYSLQLLNIISAHIDNTVKDGENTVPSHLSGPVFDFIPEQDISNVLFTSIVKRDARKKCGMAAYLDSFGPGKSKSKRDLKSSNEIQGRAHGELVDRTMTLPGNNMKRFYDDEFVSDSFIPIVWEETLNPEEGFCTALCEKIGTAQAKSFAVQHISGCTVLIIASRTAVYIGHYWENIVFSPDDDFLKGTTAKALFNDYVIQGLKVGVNNPPGTSKYDRKRQTSLQECLPFLLPDKDKNAAQHLKAYLFRPISSFDEKPETYEGYEEKWAEMRKTIGEIIPSLASVDGETINPKWTDFTYVPLNNDDEDLDKTAGKLVFKYDPDHNGQKKAALWVENDPTDRHNDQWT